MRNKLQIKKNESNFLLQNKGILKKNDKLYKYVYKNSFEKGICRAKLVYFFFIISIIIIFQLFLNFAFFNKAKSNGYITHESGKIILKKIINKKN